ncbi:MAG: carboxypeptidase-like regulatory domain-containing protein [Pseudomonadota bacterium]
MNNSQSRALFLGLALLLPSTATLAGEPIPGVDVELGKNPGGIRVSVPTGADGSYQFKRLAAGRYDLSVGGRRVQTISVGGKGGLGGVLSSENGKASITFNGQVVVMSDPPSAIINTSRSNIKRPSIAKGGDTLTGIHVAAGDLNGDGVVPDLPGAAISTSRSNIKRPGMAVQQEDANDKPPGLIGEPIPGVDIYLGKNPGGSIVASATTDNQGAFHFNKLPIGNYTLKLNGQPGQSLTVEADGIAGGKVMRGPEGQMSIFDRWGNSYTSDVSVRKTADTPVEFGNGNTMGAGPSPGIGTGMSPGTGMGSAMGPGRP